MEVWEIQALLWSVNMCQSLQGVTEYISQSLQGVTEYISHTQIVRLGKFSLIQGILVNNSCFAFFILSGHPGKQSFLCSFYYFMVL